MSLNNWRNDILFDFQKNTDDLTMANDANVKGHWIFTDYYNGKSTLQDHSGNGNDLTASGFANGVAGALVNESPVLRTGKSIQFDGVDDYFYIPAALARDFNPGTGSFTVEFWVRCDGQLLSSDDVHGIMGKGIGNNGSNAWNIAFRGGLYNGIFLRIGDGTNGIANISPSSDLSTLFTDGKLHHVAYVWDRAVQKCFLYVDGVRRNNGVDISTIGNINPDTYDFLLGKWYWGFGKVSIAEVRFSNIARSEYEIKQSYRGGHGLISSDITAFWANNAWGTLDGVNDLVDMGDVLNPGSSNAIYMLWIKIPSGQTSRAILSKWRDTNAGFSMETSANGRLIAKVSDGTTTLTTTDDGPVITDNTPRIVAVVIDRLAKQLKRYIADASGVQKIGTDLDIAALGAITNNFDFLIGARDNATQDGFINMQFGMAPQYIFADDAMMVNNAYESQIIGYFLNHTKDIYLSA